MCNQAFIKLGNFGRSIVNELPHDIYFAGRIISYLAFFKHLTMPSRKRWWLNLALRALTIWCVNSSHISHTLTSLSLKSQFFGLYGLSNRASSMVGPNVIQAIISKTGSNWHGFPFLFALCTAASLAIWFGIDVKQGRRDAMRWASLQRGWESRCCCKGWFWSWILCRFDIVYIPQHNTSGVGNLKTRFMWWSYYVWTCLEELPHSISPT